MIRVCMSGVFLLSCMCSVQADSWGLKAGTPDLKIAGPLAFGPENILFIGDPAAAAVFAVELSDLGGNASEAKVNVEDFGRKLSDVLGGEAEINDLAVHPLTGTVVVSATVNGKPALARVDSGGRISKISLQNIPFSKAQLSDAPPDKVVRRGRRQSNPRLESITDLAWFEGKVLVSGLRDAASPSSVREIAFPFAEADRGVGVQIFHAAHGREEDYAAMRTFVPLMIDGEPNLLGAYVCTPLVRIPIKEIESTTAQTVKATTVAELGNRNRPLDMISYTKNGENYLLLSNSARGVMKITTAGLQENSGIKEPVRGGGTAGQAYETVESLQGVTQMDKLNDQHAVVLIENAGRLDLKTVELP